MSYIIDYRLLEKKKPGKERKAPAIIALVIVLILLTAFFMGEKPVPEKLRQTGQALEAMAGELRSGVPMGEAVEAFCREIRDGES